MKRFFTIVLVIALLCSVSITGYAADTEKSFEKPPSYGTRMTYINQVYTSLYISSNGLSNSYSYIYAYPGVDSVRISMYLQRYNDGWETVKHWAQDFDGTYGQLSKDWYVYSGYEYRVLTYFYAYEGSATESVSLIHDDVWY
jgi:hypothetical protein